MPRQAHRARARSARARRLGSWTRGELIERSRPGRAIDSTGVRRRVRATRRRRLPRRPSGSRPASRLVPARARPASASREHAARPSPTSARRRAGSSPTTARRSRFLIDATGDVGLGADDLARGDQRRLRARGPTSPTLGPRARSTAALLPQPITFAGCAGGNRIVFNDPFNEITDPVGCSGVLAIGGFCASSETRTVNGTSFRRIRVGKITFNNGWSQLPGLEPLQPLRSRHPRARPHARLRPLDRRQRHDVRQRALRRPLRRAARRRPAPRSTFVYPSRDLADAEPQRVAGAADRHADQHRSAAQCDADAHGDADRSAAQCDADAHATPPFRRPARRRPARRRRPFRRRTATPTVRPRRATPPADAARRRPPRPPRDAPTADAYAAGAPWRPRARAVLRGGAGGARRDGHPARRRRGRDADVHGRRLRVRRRAGGHVGSSPPRRTSDFGQASRRSTPRTCCRPSPSCAALDADAAARLRRHRRRPAQRARRRRASCSSASALLARLPVADTCGSTGSSSPIRPRRSSSRSSTRSSPAAPAATARSCSTSCSTRRRTRTSAPSCSAIAPATGGRRRARGDLAQRTPRIDACASAARRRRNGVARAGRTCARMRSLQRTRPADHLRRDAPDAEPASACGTPPSNAVVTTFYARAGGILARRDGQRRADRAPHRHPVDRSSSRVADGADGGAVAANVGQHRRAAGGDRRASRAAAARASARSPLLRRGASETRGGEHPRVAKLRGSRSGAEARHRARRAGERAAATAAAPRRLSARSRSRGAGADRRGRRA